ncbi:hypothetical protein BD289DRAFT_277453 [Coniella lustricola]|uniref:Uncharacterized protein n=1 Tax=Coniella lustricola TaxID=2025994 RepID=A0A2T3A6G1_9PEZI|nr:hypothetical protein BD289DRAFT_277453 [Coniella lustricola]
MDAGQARGHVSRHADRRQDRPRTDQPWTATRCHRLLRPLRTHIAGLRREIALEHEATDAENVSQSNGAESSKSRLQYTYSRRGRKAQPLGMAAEPHRELNRTQRPALRKTVHPGDIIIPTPAIKRARDQELSSPLQQPVLEADPPLDMSSKQAKGCCTMRMGKERPRLIGALQSELLLLRGTISSARYLLCDAIFRALHTLLLTTVQPATRLGKRYSNKSLMAMCLRKVPDYIGELELLDNVQAEEKGTKSALRISEVSQSVYDSIEYMLPSGSGCPPLRLIARFHGIKMVRDALEEGLLQDSFAQILIKLFTILEAYDEAQELITIFANRTYPEPRGFTSTFHECRSLAPLRALTTLDSARQRPQFVLRYISRLFAQQQLSPQWLSTQEFAPVWTSLVKVFWKSEVCDDAISYALTAITTLASRAKTSAFVLRPKAGDLSNLTQSTLISMIAAITMLPLISHGVGAKSQNLVEQKRISIISERAVYVLFACTCELKRTRKVGWTLTVLRLAAYFASNTLDSTMKSATGALWHHILDNYDSKSGKQAYDATIGLLCSLAQNLARGAVESPHHYLNLLCDRLDAASGIEKRTSEKMRLDCAFFLAERTNDLRDLAFAETIHMASNKRPRNPDVVRSPIRKYVTPLQTGFHWDEGISEWVSEKVNLEPDRPLQRTSLGTRSALMNATSDSVWIRTLSRDLRFAHDNNNNNNNGIWGTIGFLPQRAGRQTRATTRASTYLEQRAAAQRSLHSGKRELSAISRSNLVEDMGAQRRGNRDNGDTDGDIVGSHTTTAAPRRREREESTTTTEIAFKTAGNPTKRRRVSALKRSRATLETTTPAGPHGSSDDELGL